MTEPATSGVMHPQQALSVVAQTVRQARLNADEHDLVRAAIDSLAEAMARLALLENLEAAPREARRAAGQRGPRVVVNGSVEDGTRARATKK